MKILENGIAVLENDTHISKWVESGNLSCDPSLGPCILPLINPGSTVVDVGAYIGDHTHSYLKTVGDNGRVIAFEPNPEAFECLVHNCPKAECWPCAIGSNSGFAYLGKPVHDDSEDSYNIAASFITEKKSKTIVGTVPLDYLHIDKLELIKIDVEGYELKVLKGASNTIERTKPIIVIEIQRYHLQRNGTSPEELVQHLKSIGYSVKPIYGTFDDDQIDCICTYESCNA